jgi:hypothetical protein
VKTGLYTLDKGLDGETIMVAAGSKETTREERAQKRFAKLLETHQRMEAELSRVLNRWQKSRKALVRGECELVICGLAPDRFKSFWRG